VTEEQINTFYQDGAILLKNVFSEEWVEKVKTGIEKNLANPSQYSEKLALKEGQVGSNQKQLEKYFKIDYCNWQTIDEFRDFAYYSPAAEIAGKMMQSKYAVFYHEHVLNKEPGKTRKIQDEKNSCESKELRRKLRGTMTKHITLWMGSA